MYQKAMKLIFLSENLLLNWHVKQSLGEVGKIISSIGSVTQKIVNN